MTNCHFCSELKLNSSTAIWNTPLFESSNFVVLPSLGSIIEGWLLIVPKTHFICVGEMSDLLIIEMTDLKKTVCRILEQYFGPTVLFEHAPNKVACEVGCGVDHAHVHIVPCEFDLIEAAKPFLPEGIEWSKNVGYADCKTKFLQGSEYLYIEQPIGYGQIATSLKFESQIFRKAIASHHGIPAMYNWRESKFLFNIEFTIEKLRNRFDHLYSCRNKTKIAA